MQITQLHPDVVAATRKLSFRQWPYLITLANNDAWSARNTSLLSARQACQLDDRIVAPQFALEHRLPKSTDFNDLLCLAGIDELTGQLCQARPVES